MSKQRRRIPKLKYSAKPKIGWHVCFRDPNTKKALRKRFPAKTEAEARELYWAWLAAHLQSNGEGASAATDGRHAKGDPLAATKAAPGSLLHVASTWLAREKERVRKDGAPRSQGTIAEPVYRDRRKHVRDLLTFMNERHGEGAVSRIMVADVSMSDVEAFNRRLVSSGLSASQVNKRLQVLKRIIDRSGRPEHGAQRLAWNWDSRDVLHGQPTAERKLPTLEQLKAMIAEGELRERTLIWMAIGLGFGQRDLAAVRVGQIDADGYDLRRGKTSVERYGDTPPLVWSYILSYLHEHQRRDGELMFITRTGLPLVHNRGDSVQQWWHKARKAIGESSKTLEGFYVLRHIGATEFGSRPGCSIGDMRRWLGHATSSRVADVYMKPVAPEQKQLVSWVRRRLASNKLDE